MSLRNLKSGKAPWPTAEVLAPIFNFEAESKSRVSFIFDTVTVSRHDVLTGRLPRTVEFFRAVNRSEVPTIGMDGARLDDALDVYARLATLQSISRCGVGRVVAPSVRIRKAVPAFTPFREGADHYHTPILVVPFDLLSRACEMEAAYVRSLLTPFVKDGAAEFVRLPSGAAAAMIVPGFVSDNAWRHLYIS